MLTDSFRLGHWSFTRYFITSLNCFIEAMFSIVFYKSESLFYTCVCILIPNARNRYAFGLIMMHFLKREYETILCVVHTSPRIN